MPSSNSLRWTPDVFVSYKDNDNKVWPFTSILFSKLKQAGIGSIDSRKSDDDLFIAIRQAKFALVVFSANYAVSKQCLDDLVEILLRRGNSKYPNLVVIPIYHGIKPTEALELQIKGEVKKALEKLSKDARDVKEDEWIRALAKVEGIPGYNLGGDANNDSELVNEIVDRLFNEIWSLYSHKVFGPFGGRGEIPWHSKMMDRIQIFYTDFVESITFEVEQDTNTKKHNGKANENNPYKVELKEGEHIISFSGNFQKAKDGLIRIKALRFQTTQGGDLRVGQIDEEREDYFCVPLPPGAGKVIEFFGSKSKGFPTSIGVRVVELHPEVSSPVGLFGSRKGVKWDAKQHTLVKGIRAVRVSRDNRCIRSIAFLNDNREWWPPGSAENGSNEFTIDGPGEYLSSISGYCNYDGITSLTFLTNKRKTKTIGDGKGTHFSSPKTGYEIVGFYGWSDKHLYGIGAYFKQILNLNQVKSIGPFGGGIAWDDRKFKGVKKIHIYRAGDIRYIKIVYVDDSGNDCPIIHGDYIKKFSNKEETMDLDHPQEYLTWISGYTRPDGSIKSLTFHSNRQKRCFGKPEGWGYFGYPSNKSRIIGFYGTFGKTLNSIGVYEEPVPSWEPSKHMPAEFQGFGGDDWDDGEHFDVVGYRVTQIASSKESKEKLKIESITFMYGKNGSLVEGPPRGGGDPSSGEWVMLDYPKERLLRIRGYWREEAGETIIHDLKIVTTYGRPLTYANREEPDSDSKPNPKPTSTSTSTSKAKKFTILEKSDEGRRIVGFFGKAKTCLNFIGAYLEP